MKTIILGLIFLGFAGSALAIDSAELDTRLNNLTSLFQDMQTKPDRSIPPEILRNAKGIVMIDLAKAGFGFAYQHGAGVALVRDPDSGKWSPPAFVEANQGSVGFQAGGEQAFCVIVLMTTNAAHALTQANFAFDAEVGGTAGYSSGDAQTKSSTVEKEAVIYADRNGLFAGAAVKFGGLTPDDNANTVYYDRSLTMEDILFHHEVKPTEAAAGLAQAIKDSAKMARGN
jgi:lipid-binding SYLF domain-containing protein